MRISEKLKTEEALLRVAESLLEQGGPDAVTTRAVCDAANVGAPTLYHHYGDKNRNTMLARCLSVCYWDDFIDIY